MTASSPTSPPRDHHLRRSGEDYAKGFAGLLPQGIAWSREPDSVLMRVCKGLANLYGFVDSRAADLLERETDPRKTIELLPEWERAFGLPNACFLTATTIAERQKLLVLWMTWLGGQSRKYFTDLMALLGYEIHIKEFSPFMAGVSRCGDTRPTKFDDSGNLVVDTSANFRWYIGPPEQRFYFSVEVGQVALIWFRAASGQAGVDPHLKFGVPDEVACLLDLWKPAHTDVVMDFSSLALGGPMQGTP